MIRTAVILAAGMGTRLKGLVGDIPKGLISFAGQTLIERSILQLCEQGIERILIVTGHLAHHYKRMAEDHPSIELIHNREYARSGSMYSFFCCRDMIQEDILLLESDLIYETRGLTALLSSGVPDQILISGDTDSGDEVYVETLDGRITGLSKNKAELGHVAGELVGISKFSKSFCSRMFAEAGNLFRKSLMVEYEQCVVQAASHHPVYFLKIDDLVWAEIDDENHLNRVKEKILPSLKIKSE